MIKYLITDGNNYVILLNGKYTFTTHRHKAEEFKNKDKVKNVFNQVSKENKNLKIEEFDTETIEANYRGKYMDDYITDLANEEYKEYSDNLLEYSLDNVLDLLSSLSDKLNNEKIKNRNNLIKCCKILADLKHYKELFPKRSASERCNLDIFETKVLLKRRELKDNILKIEAIEENLKGNKKVLNLDDRKYIPRILSDLFETNIVPKFEEWWVE